MASHPSRHGSPHPTRRRTRPPHRLATALAGIATALILPAAAAAAGATPNTDDRPIPAAGAGPVAAPEGIGGSVLRLAFGLVVVVGLIAAVWWVMKRVQRSRYPGGDGGGGAAVEVVATTALGPNRALHLVRFGDRTILVGATEHAITPVASLGPDETDAELLERAARDPGLARRIAPAAATGERARFGARADHGIVERLRALTVRR